MADIFVFVLYVLPKWTRKFVNTTHANAAHIITPLFYDFISFLQLSLLANVAVFLIPVSDQNKKSLNSIC